MWRGMAVALILGTVAASAVAMDDRAAERQSMVDSIERLALSIGGRTGHAKLDRRVLDALRRVPRHEFVPAAGAAMAYADRPLDIGRRQSISQPFVVAFMTHLLQVRPDDRVLEIGTGSGYQAAVLSLLAREVYSVEIVAELGSRAAQTLQRLGYANVAIHIGDGYRGWDEHAPYDRIIVTAAPDHVPPDLLAQLKPGGRLVIPVGSTGPGAPAQDLMVIEKAADGTTTGASIVPVHFVPLVRGAQPD